MKNLTDTDREALAARLQDMKRNVLEELRRSAPGAGEAEARIQEHEVHSQADEAEAERLVDLRSAEIELDRARLRNIDEAQQRMAAGRYGICIDCGEAIARERLLAQPIAIRCAACQASLETRQRR